MFHNRSWLWLFRWAGTTRGKGVPCPWLVLLREDEPHPHTAAPTPATIAAAPPATPRRPVPASLPASLPHILSLLTLYRIGKPKSFRSAEGSACCSEFPSHCNGEGKKSPSAAHHGRGRSLTPRAPAQTPPSRHTRTCAHRHQPRRHQVAFAGMSTLRPRKSRFGRASPNDGIERWHQ